MDGSGCKQTRIPTGFQGWARWCSQAGRPPDQGPASASLPAVPCPALRPPTPVPTLRPPLRTPVPHWYAGARATAALLQSRGVQLEMVLDEGGLVMMDGIRGPTTTIVATVSSWYMARGARRCARLPLNQWSVYGVFAQGGLACGVWIRGRDGGHGRGRGAT